MSAAPKGDTPSRFPRHRALGVLGCMMGVCVAFGGGGVLTGCDPATNPVPVATPPRDPGEAKVLLLRDGVESKTFQQDANLNLSDRVFFGSWEGARAQAFVEVSITDTDTLPPAGATVTSAQFAFNCVGGQGPRQDIPIATILVAPSDSNWIAEDPVWPGPDLTESIRAATTADRCVDQTADSVRSYPEVILNLPVEAVQSWLDGYRAEDDASNRGFAIRGATDAGLFSFASFQNVFFDSVGMMVPTPRVSYTVADSAATFFFPSLLSDAYAVAPDSAALPCADPTDCVQIGKGAAWRSMFRFDTPDLPEGSNVHRAVLRLSVLGHPRFDSELLVDVLNLTSEWPEDAPADSLIETSGVIWSDTELTTDLTEIELPITNLVQSWFDGTIENNGMLVRTSKVDEGFTAVSFASSTHPTVTLRPELEITYTEPQDGRP